jgi:hypothetical protein
MILALGEEEAALAEVRHPRGMESPPKHGRHWHDIGGAGVEKKLESGKPCQPDERHTLADGTILYRRLLFLQLISFQPNANSSAGLSEKNDPSTGWLADGRFPPTGKIVVCSFLGGQLAVASYRRRHLAVQQACWRQRWRILIRLMFLLLLLLLRMPNGVGIGFVVLGFWRIAFSRVPAAWGWMCRFFVCVFGSEHSPPTPRFNSSRFLLFFWLLLKD